MKRFLGVLLVIIFFMACADRRPKSIFPEKKMIDVLFDLHLADAYMGNQPLDTLNGEKVNYYLTVYKKYDTDSAHIRESLEYYASHPQELQDIYAEVSKRLQQSEEQLRDMEVEKYRQVVIQDSINSRRKIDSVKLRKRDSVMLFNGEQDLFLHSLDSARKSLDTKDSLDTSVEKRSIMEAFLKEQKRWEMIFYYFGESNILPSTVVKPTIEAREGDQPVSKNEGKGMLKPIKERIRN